MVKLFNKAIEIDLSYSYLGDEVNETIFFAISGFKWKAYPGWQISLHLFGRLVVLSFHSDLREEARYEAEMAAKRAKWREKFKKHRV